MGYIRAKSIPSLVAGVGFGTGYVAAGYMISNAQEKNGHLLNFALSSALALGMGARGVKTSKPVPVAVGGLGFLAAGYSGMKAAEWWDS